MSRRAAFTYLAIALLLGGAYFLVTRWDERKTERESLEKRLFRMSVEDVAGLRVEHPGEPEITIARASPGNDTKEGTEDGTKAPWRITAPRALPADQSAVGSVIRAMVESEKLRGLEGEGLDPAEYGLDNPSLRVSVEAGGAWRTIAFGAESITREARYARLEGDPQIFLVGASSFNRMDRGLEALRDRRLLPLDPARLQAITLTRGKERIALRKEAGVWRFENSPRPVSETAVNGLIGALTETEVDRFVIEEETDLAPYGLDAPEVAANFIEDGETRWVRLAKAPESSGQEGVLAVRSSAPGVVALPETLLDRIPVSAGEMEDKTLYRGELPVAHAVGITGPGAKARFVREGDAWRQAEGTAPVRAAGEAKEGDEEKPDVEGLLTLLQDLSHEGAPGEGQAGVKQDEAVIAIETKDGASLMKLAIAAGAPGDEERPALLTDADGERAILISRFTLENLYDKLRALAPGVVPAPGEREAGDG